MGVGLGLGAENRSNMDMVPNPKWIHNPRLEHTLLQLLATRGGRHLAYISGGGYIAYLHVG